MGTLKAVIASVESTFGDQWKELFYCDALSDTTLIARGQKYVSGCAENTFCKAKVLCSLSVI